MFAVMSVWHSVYPQIGAAHVTVHGPVQSCSLGTSPSSTVLIWGPPMARPAPSPDLFKLVHYLVHTLGPTYNELGYNNHPVTRSRFLCIKIIWCNVKKLVCNEYPLLMSMFLLHLFTRCKRDPVYIYWHAFDWGPTKSSVCVSQDHSVIFPDKSVVTPEKNPGFLLVKTCHMITLTAFIFPTKCIIYDKI